MRYSLPLFVVFPLKSHGKLIMLGKTKVWSASALSLGLVALLSGCAGVQTTPGRYHIASDALKKPVDYTRVCVLENPAVKADVLIEAIQDGINAAKRPMYPFLRVRDRRRAPTPSLTMYSTMDECSAV